MTWISTWWQQVSGTAAAGLRITIVGMALVFLTLGLIIVALVLLTRLPGLRADRQRIGQDTEAGPTSRQETDSVQQGRERGEAELARVAAIAVALLRAGASQPRPTGKDTAASRWKQYGRAHQVGL